MTACLVVLALTGLYRWSIRQTGNIKQRLWTVTRGGALGGAVFVNVCNTEPVIDLYFIRVSEKPHCVYSGEWGGYKGMELYWKDNHILSVNGSDYFVG